MYYEKQKIMHNYGQLSRGRGGGNKWSCRELATQQRAHYTLGKEGHNMQGGLHWAKKNTLCIAMRSTHYTLHTTLGKEGHNMQGEAH